MKKTRIIIYLSFCFPVLFSQFTWAEPITTGTLIDQMVDLKQLAEFPDVYCKTVQFSSYDRRSKTYGDTMWFANSDGFGGEPIPNFEKVLVAPDTGGVGEYLICDVQGPGAIVRVWTAAITGTIRLYLDDLDTPIYDGPAKDFLMYPYRTFAQKEGIEEAVFTGTYQQREACYFPMPFAKRCRMIWKGNCKQIHFYQVQIRLYDKNAQVKTFESADLKKYESKLRNTAKILSNPNENWPCVSDKAPIVIEGAIAPNSKKELLTLEGPLAIEKLSLRIHAPDLNRALRQSVLRICFDDNYWGQVQSPVGDFFGAGPGINPFDSLPFTVEPDGTMICRFTMPFAKSCKIIIDNKADQPVKVEGSVVPMAYDWSEDSSMHFQAKWRVDHDLVANPPGNGSQDIPYLIANGQGRYIGSAVMLMNPCNIPTGYGGWWGEGDEKIYVDSDTFPSTFGTGSEDYYNYAWSSPDIIIQPYFAQPRNDGPGNRGFVVNSRWHILDSLLFNNHLSFYMELANHFPNVADFTYARSSYIYARPGLRDDHVPITTEDVRHLILPANWQPIAECACRGAIFFQAEDVLVGKPNSVTIVSDPLWSGDKLLKWKPADENETLGLELDIPEDGKYNLCAIMELSPDSAMFVLTLGDRNIGFDADKSGVNLFESFRTMSRRFQSNPIELKKGKHIFKLHKTGGNPDKHIGIDFLYIIR